MSQTATLILTHGQIHTLDRANPLAEAVAIADGKIVATGSHDRIMSFAAEGTQIVDLKGHTVIPGLNDSHLHLIRGGLNYNLELRWEGVPSLADALRMLKDQADRTPSPQWGAGGRRLERISVRRAADADPGRAERGGA
ncbi:exoenzymes regulatory protein AepA [Klebsiella pneumoniae subsp. pneumoniae]|nr:exoenzymes regulatory protein AepA [Klebsiella pneumoniae subsp. pneumoniae]